MSKLKHTPGPWEIEGTFVYSLQDCEWLGNPSKENRFDLNIQGFKCPQEEKEANARLVAAAPEMLEALINVKKYGCSGYIDGSKSDIEFWFKIDMAIKKATGLTIEEMLNEN